MRKPRMGLRSGKGQSPASGRLGLRKPCKVAPHDGNRFRDESCLDQWGQDPGTCSRELCAVSHGCGPKVRAPLLAKVAATASTRKHKL